MTSTASTVMLMGMFAIPHFDSFGFLLLFLGLAAVWVVQFVQLMALSDTDFPGRYDKLLWVAAFVLVVPIAPFAFLVWKGAISQVRGRRE